ncbi:MAG TPA: glycosyltransferase family 2 protein [Vicinamibacterales bacterium]|nr:glycosyltransferase family 2 protein [Vicinamibacterales bacterium]
MMADAARVSIVIPACNEADAIGGVIGGLRAAAAWHEILVVDDGSTDATSAEAEAAGARVIRHPYNKGNGAAVKSGIRAATGEVILIMDGDGQHQPADALRLAGRVGEYDLVVGARRGATQAGTTRRAGNALLNRLASFLSEREIPDLTSGFRAARAECLREFIHLLPNGFSTPTTTTLAFLRAGYSVAFEPIDARRRGEPSASKIRLSRDGPKFLLIMLRVITIFSPLRIFLPIAGVAFLLGAGYGIWTLVNYTQVTDATVLLVTLAVIIFLVGLVSEQIAALRFDGRR